MSRRRIVIWVKQGSKRKTVSKKREKKKKCEKRELNSCYDTLLDVLHRAGGSGPD